VKQIITTVACRPCHAGWYGEDGDRCPRCKGEVVVTDQFVTVSIRETA
jgi:predicted Zn-ribbon and HTH transcriptional regulator